MFLQDNKSVLIITALTIIGLLLRFYNLDWGAPFYFHPDERNMAMAINQLSFPTQMNPHFFAYGSLPLYLIFFTGLFTNFFTICQQAITPCTVSFEQAIIVSRSFTAVFSVLLIPLIAYVGTRLYGKTAGILSASLMTFSVGMIQFAHFGTTEMWLTFFSVILFLILLLLQHKYSVYLVILLGIVFGILVGTKISALALGILPIYSLVIGLRKHTSFSHFRVLLLTAINGVAFISIAVLIFFLTNPFVALDFSSFQDSMRYETSLASGTLPVFYTQEFTDTTPILFQFLHVYPFLLNPLLTILIVPSLVILLFRIIRYRDTNSVLVLLTCSVLFFSQAFLFVKWTRYMLPTLPFLYLIMVGAADTIVKQHFFFLKSRSFRYSISTLLIILCSVFAFSYVITAFAERDTRVAAAAFAAQTIPENAMIVSEVYDLGIVPFNPLYPNITLFNFYDTEHGNPDATPERLAALTKNADYIVLPSQRLYKTRTLHTERFPISGAFYTDLADENGFRKIYESPCSVFCAVTYLGSPVFAFETTANVFDRPTVMIYQKVNP